MAALTIGQASLVARLRNITSLDAGLCAKCLIATEWNYDLALKNIVDLRNLKDKEIMTMEDKIEFLLLSTVLNDRLYCTNLEPETLGKLLIRYNILLDKFVEQYELPNSINSSLRD